MRLLDAVAIVALGLAGFASAGAQSAPALQPGVTRIVFETTSWGYTTERWSIAEAGEASLERLRPNANLSDPLEQHTFSISQSDFAQVRAALADEERYAGQTLPCEFTFTDAPSGHITWTRADGSELTVRWYIGCRRTPERDAFFERTGAADEIFHRITDTN